jgi:hypothetical protein
VVVEVLAPDGVVVCAGIHMSDIPSFPEPLDAAIIFAPAGPLVPQALGRRYLRIAEMEIGATHAASVDLEQQLPGAGHRIGKDGRLQRLPLAFEDHRAHRPHDAARVGVGGH